MADALSIPSKEILAILSQHKSNTKELSEKYQRHVITSDARFANPFTQSVVHGLFSGEKREGRFTRFFRKMSCEWFAGKVYDMRNTESIEAVYVSEAIRDIFNTSYSLGLNFHDIPDFREGGIIRKISPETGMNFVYMMANGVGLNVSNLRDFSKSVWIQYATQGSPRLLA